MKKYFNLTGFYPFERKQFEDFLNDMAKKGYHLKKINSFFSEYEEKTDDIYYHVAIHGSNKYFFEDELKDKEYIAFFKDNGYEFIDKQGIFYVFASHDKHSIYTDEQIDEDVIYKQSQKSFRGFLIAVITFILLGFLTPDYVIHFDNLLSTHDIVFVFSFWVWLMIIMGIGCQYIYYFFKKECHYSYYVCLLRNFMISFAWLQLIVGSVFFTRHFVMIPIFILLGCICVSFIAILFSYSQKNPILFQKNVLLVYIICLCLGSVVFIKDFSIKYTSFNSTYFQDYIISYDSHSIVLDYYEYAKDDNQIKYVSSVYPDKSLDILNLYLQDHYTKYQKNQVNGYYVYQTPISTIIYKNHQFIEINKIDNQKLKQVLDNLNW